MEPFLRRSSAMEAKMCDISGSTKAGFAYRATSVAAEAAATCVTSLPTLGTGAVPTVEGSKPIPALTVGGSGTGVSTTGGGVTVRWWRTVTLAGL